MPRTDVNGVRLYYEDRRRGLPLVCLAGALGTGGSDFGPSLDAWAKHFWVISWNLEGNYIDKFIYGGSSRPAWIALTH